MQSESTTLSKKTSLGSNPDTHHHPSQYGLQQHHDEADSFLRRGARAADEQSPAGVATPPETDLAKPREHDFYQPQRRLSSTSSRSSKRTGSPVDRIIEHEEAVVNLPKRKSESPVFTVIRRKTSSSQRVHLTDFPNGGLPITAFPLATS